MTDIVCDVVNVRVQGRVAPREEAATANTGIAVTSQYLHVAESDDLPSARPPVAVFSTKTTSAAKRLDRMYSVEKETSPTGLPPGTASSDAGADHFYMNNGSRKMPAQQSRSTDNLSHYVGMSGDGSQATALKYVNDGTDPGVYSYARTFNLSLPRSATTSSAKNRKLKKTSSTPTMLDADTISSAAVHSRGDTSNKDDYVPASPPSAAVSEQSASEVDPTSKALKLTMSSVSNASSTSDAQSPSVLSPVAGVSMSTRSRVFTRQK